MTFTFAAQVAWDPIGKQAIKNTSFQVYATTDTGYTTPLPITDPFGNPMTGNILNSGSQGVFPQFNQASNSAVVLADLSRIYSWTINCVPTDAAIANFVSTPGTATAGALSATYAPAAGSTAYAAKSVETSKLDASQKAAPSGVASLDSGSRIPVAQIPDLSAYYVPKWQPLTFYPYGSVVASPSGNLVTAKSSHTSGATFTVTNWAPMPALGSLVTNVLDYGAVPDGVKKTSGGSITIGTTTFTSSLVNFAATDTGKNIWVLGAGASGAVLAATITGFTDSHTVTLSVAAATTVTNAQFVYGTINDTAFQNALNAIKTNGGVVFVPAQGMYLISSAPTVWSRCRLVGGSASPNGCVLLAAPGITGSVLKLGATDGTDPNWHWGGVETISIDGNKAFQSAQPTIAVTAASNSSSVIATITTAAAHGFALGDSIELTGFTPSGYNGRYFVNNVISSTQFTFNLVTGSPVGTVMGTVRRVLQGIGLAQAGETSHFENVVVQNCFNDGIHHGPIGTPMRYTSVSVMSNNDAGINLWTDRPVYLDSLSGDTNGQCLIRINGKSKQSGGNNVGTITMVNPKAENATTPFLIIDDYGHAINVLGGSIVMAGGNTQPVIQRTAQSSANAPLNVIGLVVAPQWSGSGNVYQDLSANANSVNGNASASSYTFFLSTLNPVGIQHFTTRRVTLTDAATVVVNPQNGEFMNLTCTRTSRTMGVPTIPVGAPNAERMTFWIGNNSGAATTTTWDPTYKLAGPWVDAANGYARTIEFFWNGTNMVEINRSQADMPI